ncbi:MAG: hypothetical protein ACE5IC_10585 [Candidatus Brocadiales bacterium]
MSPCHTIRTVSLRTACSRLTIRRQEAIQGALGRLEIIGFKYGLELSDFDVLVFPRDFDISGKPRPFYNLTLLSDDAFELDETLLDCLLLHEYFHCLISWQAFHNPYKDNPEMYRRVREFITDWKAEGRELSFSLEHRDEIKHSVYFILKDMPWVAWGIRGSRCTRSLVTHFVNKYYRLAAERLNEAELAYFQLLGKSVFHERVGFSTIDDAGLFMAFLGFEYGEFLVEELEASNRSRIGRDIADYEEGLCTYLSTAILDIPLEEFKKVCPQDKSEVRAAHALEERYGCEPLDVIGRVKGGIPVERIF